MLKHSPTRRTQTSSLVHWNYFLSIEKDVLELSRFIEFSGSNLNTYSTEIARILMSATQECDVLLKQVCLNSHSNEQGYRADIPQQHPLFCDQKVLLPRYDLSFTPFTEWKQGKTPSWWTANNKVKHERHNKFEMASLENMLNSVSALLLSNIYYYHNLLFQFLLLK